MYEVLLQGLTLGTGATLDIPWLQSQSLAAIIWKQRSGEQQSHFLQEHGMIGQRIKALK